ncbi:hypothetical protein Tco_0430451 [Tanacetum coccineum]
MITTNNSIKDKKPSRLMLLSMGILETFPCVKDVDYITRDLAVSSVRTLCKSALLKSKEPGHKKAYLETSLLLFTLEFQP